jgi:hypothetical protein
VFKLLGKLHPSTMHDDSSPLRLLHHRVAPIGLAPCKGGTDLAEPARTHLRNHTAESHLAC